jgi:hypothetical protein
VPRIGLAELSEKISQVVSATACHFEVANDLATDADGCGANSIQAPNDLANSNQVKLAIGEIAFKITVHLSG